MKKELYYFLPLSRSGTISFWEINFDEGPFIPQNCSAKIRLSGCSNTGRESHPAPSLKKNLHQHMYGISRILIHAFDMAFGRLNKADHQIRWSNQKIKFQILCSEISAKIPRHKKLDKKQYSSIFIGSEVAERHFHSVFWTKRIQIIGKVLGSMERRDEPVSLNIF